MPLHYYLILRAKIPFPYEYVCFYVTVILAKKKLYKVEKQATRRWLCFSKEQLYKINLQA